MCLLLSFLFAIAHKTTVSLGITVSFGLVPGGLDVMVHLCCIRRTHKDMLKEVILTGDGKEK